MPGSIAEAKVTIRPDLSGFRADVEAGVRSAVQTASTRVTVGADTRQAASDIDQLRAKIDTLRQQVATARVHVDSGDSKAKLDELTVKLDDFARKTATADLSVRDVAEVDAELTGVQHELDRIDGRTVTAHVRVDGADEAGREASGASGGIGLLGASLIALGPAALAAASALAPAVGALAAMPALFAGIGTGVGAAILGFSGVAGALKALDTEQRQAGTSAASNARAQQAAAAAVVSATEQVRNARQSLAQAEEQAAATQVNSAEQVARAEETLAQTEQQVALQRVQAAQQVATAEYALTQANQAAANAQQALNQAREQAARDLEDAANRQVDAQLNAQQAALDLTQAQQNLNALNANANSTDLQREQAALAVEQAQQRLVEANEQAARSTADNTAAQAAGVDGSQKVLSATQQLANAQHQQAQAVQALADAQAAQTRQAIDGAQKVADAERSVTDALRAQAQQREQSSFAILRAEQAVSAALRGQQQAEENLAAAGDTASASANKAAQAMAALTPAGRQFVLFLESLKPVLTELKTTAQADLLPGVEAGIKALLPVLPVFNKAIGDAASGLGGFFANLGQLVSSPEFSRDLPGLLSSSTGLMNSLGTAALSIFDALRNVAVAAEPMVHWMGEAAKAWAANLDAWSRTDRASGALTSFFNATRTALHDLGELLGNVGGIIAALFRDATPAGQGVLQTLIDLTGRFRDFLNSTEGRQKIGEFFAFVGQSFAVMATGVEAIAHVISTVLAPVFDWLEQNPAFTKLAATVAAAAGAFLLFQGPISGLLGLLSKIGPALGLIFSPEGLIIAGVALLGAAIYETYQHSKAFRDAIDILGRDLTALFMPIIDEVHDHIGSLTGVIRDVIDWITNHLGPVLTSMAQFFDATVNIIKDLWDRFGQHLIDHLKTAMSILGEVLSGAFEIIRGIFDIFTALLTGNWGKFWHGLYEIVDGVWKILEGLIRSIINTISTIIGAGMAVISAIWSVVWNDIKQAAIDIWHGISDFFAAAFHDFTHFFSTTWTGVKQVFDDVWGGIEHGASSVWTTIRGFFITGINDVIGLLDDFIHAIDDVLGFFHLPQIPTLGKIHGASPTGDQSVGPSKMATGGTIGSGFSTSRPVAIVGEGNPLHPEYVIPTDPQHRGRALGLYQSLGAQLMDDGGVIGKVQSLFGGALSGGVGAMLNAAEAPARALLHAMPAGMFRNLINALIGMLNKGVENMIGDGGGLLSDVFGGLSSAVSMPSTSSLIVQASLGIGQKMAAARGWTGVEWDDLKALWQRESGWNYKATNPTSGAYGIPQSLPADKMASAGPDWHDNPATQIAWGLGYIDNRYGDPAAAWAHEGTFGWYDQGGVLPPGGSWAANGTGRPEAILTERQWQAIYRAATRNHDVSVTVLGNLDNVTLSQLRQEIDGALTQHTEDLTAELQAGVL